MESSTRYAYDIHGRTNRQSWVVEGTTYSIDLTYDAIGQLAQIAYPELSIPADRVKVNYVYTKGGYLAEVRDPAQPTPYWQSEVRNAAGQLVRERFRNNMIGFRSYSSTTGLVYTIESRLGNTPRDSILYSYDNNRNVTVRHDVVGQNARRQEMTYDELNRLRTWQPQPGPMTTFAYNRMGNLLSEITTGTPETVVNYTYGQGGAPRHALTSRGNATYTYDQVGRQITGPNRTVDYNRFDLPSQITRNGQTTEFAYSADGSRVLKRDAEETVVSLAGLFERRIGTNIRNIHYIVADGRVVAQVARTQANPNAPSSNPEIRYLHEDAQGNITQTTDEQGQLAEEFFYDPFGRRTNRNYEPLSIQRRDFRLGYTSHDHDDELGLINMKGRLYDPTARSFLTPDPFIPDPLLSQSYNRYSYVMNHPATRIDPTGFQDAAIDERKHREDESRWPGSGPPGIGNPSTAPGGVIYPTQPWGVAGANGGGTSPGGAGPWETPPGGSSSDDDNGTDGSGGEPGSGSAGGPTDNWVTPNGTGPGWDSIWQPAPETLSDIFLGGPGVMSIFDAYVNSCYQPQLCAEAFMGGYIGTLTSARDTLDGLALLYFTRGLSASTKGLPAARAAASVPGRVASRINVSNSGWAHVVGRHFAGSGSRFSVTQGELRTILSSRQVVGSPVVRTLESAEGVRYLRQVDMGRTIGFDKFAGADTSILSVLSDKFGNLITAFPGVLK